MASKKAKGNRVQVILECTEILKLLEEENKVEHKVSMARL